MKNLLITSYANYLLLSLKVQGSKVTQEITISLIGSLYSKIGFKSMVDDGTLREVIEGTPIKEMQAITRKLKETKNLGAFVEEILEVQLEHMTNSYNKGALHAQRQDLESILRDGQVTKH